MRTVDEPWLAGLTPDHADAFAVRLPPADRRTAEEWARRALEELPWPVRVLALTAQRRVLGLRLGDPADAGTVMGWRLVRVEREVVQLAAGSPLLDAVLVFRTTDPARLVLTTAITYRRPGAARLVWGVVAPLHRAVARYLLWHAARSRGRAPRGPR